MSFCIPPPLPPPNIVKDELNPCITTSAEVVIQGFNSSLTMLGGGSGGGIQNDNTQTQSKNFDESPQVTNDMDDEIPF